MDTSSQWPQGIGSVVVRAVENKTNNKRPNKEQLQANNLNCPRCNSNNTKFCYYNNYSLSQPRYLCKTCKRYWTEGGNLRSVPVGGGSRRNKRPSSPSSTNTSSKKVMVPNNNLITQNPKTGHDDHHIGRQTLNLDFNPSASSSNNGMMLPDQFGAFPFGLTLKNPQNQNPSFSSSGFSNYNNNYLPFSSLITMPPLPSLGFDNNLQSSSSRIVFPFEELNNNKPVSSTSEFDEQGKRQQGDLNGDWNNGSW